MEQTPDFKAIHAEAAQIVQHDPILAYAISTALRKQIVGRTPDTAKFDLLTSLAYRAWNDYIEIQRRDDPRNTVRILNLLVDTIIVAHDILNERYAPHAPTNGSPRK